MAKRTGVSPSTVQRIWSARGIQPHRVETFKLSNDPDFEEKLVDVVGLYMNPPEKAVVLCMDEKSQIQALDRTQPSLPIKPGRAGTMTHDYKRNGTTTLFAALDVLSGRVIGQCQPRHRHTEFLTLLKTIDREVPKRLNVHLVLDNYDRHHRPHPRKSPPRPSHPQCNHQLNTGHTTSPVHAQFRRHPCRRATTSRSDPAPPQARDQQRHRVPDDRSDPERPAHATKVGLGPPTFMPGAPNISVPFRSGSPDPGRRRSRGSWAQPGTE